MRTAIHIAMFNADRAIVSDQHIGRLVSRWKARPMQLRSTLILLVATTASGLFRANSVYSQADLRGDCTACNSHACTCSQGIKCCSCAAGETAMPPPGEPSDPATRDLWRNLKAHQEEIFVNMVLQIESVWLGMGSPQLGMAFEASVDGTEAYQKAKRAFADTYAAIQASLQAVVTSLAANIGTSKIGIPDPFASPVSYGAKEKINEGLNKLPKDTAATAAAKACQDQYNQAVAGISQGASDDIARIKAHRSMYDRGSDDTSGSDLAIKGVEEEADLARQAAQKRYDDCVGE